MRIFLMLVLLLPGPLLSQTTRLPMIGDDAPRAQPRAGPVEVDLELLLLVDVSRSMSSEEHAVQRRGYAAALTGDAVTGAIGRGLIGRVAVAYVEWAGAGGERIVVDWTLIAGRADAEGFAATLLARAPYSYNRTSITSALRFAAGSFDGNGFDGIRQVIDISGDGPNNQGGLVTEARDALLLRGITINGLPIMAFSDVYDRWSIPDLDRYYEACVIGGPGAFVVAVESADDLAAAIERKLVLEIAGRAPPRAVPVQAYDCRIGEKIWQGLRGSRGRP